MSGNRFCKHCGTRLLAKPDWPETPLEAEFASHDPKLTGYGERALHTTDVCRDTLAKNFSKLLKAGYRVAMQQPAVHAKTQAEADLWAAFYEALNVVPIAYDSDSEHA